MDDRSVSIVEDMDGGVATWGWAVRGLMAKAGLMLAVLVCLSMAVLSAISGDPLLTAIILGWAVICAVGIFHTGLQIRLGGRLRWDRTHLTGGRRRIAWVEVRDVRVVEHGDIGALEVHVTGPGQWHTIRLCEGLPLPELRQLQRHLRLAHRLSAGGGSADLRGCEHLAELQQVRRDAR